MSIHQQRLLKNYDPGRRQMLEGMLSRIELEIITACNLKCYNCDRSSRQAVSGERMTVGQVAHFVDESLDLDWRWRKIALLGGEPTLHPHLFTILDQLKRYRDHVPQVTIQITTNGYGERVNAVLKRLPDWVVVRDTRKKSVVQPFTAYNVAPCDLDEFADADYSTGCTIPFQCGMALTRYGYYPCGAGAGIDRIFGFGVGVRALRDVTPERLVSEFSRLCRLCGHFHGRKANAEMFSETWTEAYRRWREKRPRLALFPSAVPTRPTGQHSKERSSRIDNERNP